MKALIIIPAYNEEATIAHVIRQIVFYIPEADILVVNDGSSDNTSSTALSTNVNVADLPFNLGIGGAVQTGYLYAKEKNYDIAIQVDGDGQHNPAYIRKMMEPVINNRADMVIGSRYINKTSYRSPIPRRIGMLFFSILIKLLTGQKVNDTTSGFRVVNKNLINIFCRSYPSDFPEVDVLARLFKKKFRIMEMPVEMLKRQGGKSSITPFRSIYYMVKVSLSLIIGTIGTMDS